MAQINLLKQKQASSSDALQTITSLVVKFLVALLVGLIAYYAFLLYRTSSEAKKAVSLEQQISDKGKQLASRPERNELLTRQQQLKELNTLVSAHPYWSGMLPAMAKVMLTTANVVSFKALQDGTIAMTVTVPNISDVERFLQVFDLPEFNNNFYNIRIGSLGKSQSGDSLLISFDVRMNYNPALLVSPEGAR